MCWCDARRRGTECRARGAAEESEAKGESVRRQRGADCETKVRVGRKVGQEPKTGLRLREAAQTLTLGAGCSL